MTLLERLKAETSQAHEQIESDLHLPEHLASRAAYRALLQRFYGFHAAWEPRARPVIDDPAFFDPRAKADLLVHDLCLLGMERADVAALPRCEHLPPMANRAAAFGALYVVEGSTLGGTVIAHQAERALGLTHETGCAYFRCYGAEVGRMWRRFGERLTALSSPAFDDEAVAGAQQTFACLHEWLCRADSERAERFAA